MTDEPGTSPTDVETWLAAAPRVQRGADESAETLPAQIETRIAELIELGNLSPGSRLPSERDLARIFGVSRLAVREAANRLEARGLLRVRRGAGSFVAVRTAAGAEPVDERPPAPANLDELADVRMLLEPAAADWAARRADRTSLGILLRIADRFEEAAASSAPRFDLLAASDIALHLEIAHAADNALLAQLIGRLQTMHRFQLEWSLQRPGRLEQTAVEHRRVVDAVAAGEPAAARGAMAAHLDAAAASFRALAVHEAPLD